MYALPSVSPGIACPGAHTVLEFCQKPKSDAKQRSPNGQRADAGLGPIWTKTEVAPYGRVLRLDSEAGRPEYNCVLYTYSSVTVKWPATLSESSDTYLKMATYLNGHLSEWPLI